MNVFFNLAILIIGLIGGLYCGVSAKMTVKDAKFLLKFGCAASLVAIVFFYLGSYIGLAIDHSFWDIVTLQYVGFGGLIVPFCYALVLFSAVIIATINVLPSKKR